MKRLLPFALALFAATMFFTACGDDDSSSFVEPEKESSSSEILSSGDGTSDGNGDKSSSSVSSSTTNSSSSAKSSSSTGDKNSGGESNPASSSVKSSSSGTSADSSAGNSSSSSESALEPCDAAEEGETKRVLATGVRYICKNGFWVEVESSSSVSSSSYFDMTEQFNPDVKYGEFTDPRDGQKYRTVTIDYKYHMRGVDSVTIFAENLNYGERVPGGTVQGKGTKYCYDDDPWYCDNGWGGLYTWSNAMGFPAVCDSFSVASEKCPNKFDLSSENENFNGDVLFTQHQGICPDGWHVMNEDVWTLLSEMSGSDVAYYMGSKVTGFGSKNSYGLSILPAGYWQEKKFEHITESVGYYLPQQHKSQGDVAQAAYVNKNSFSRSGGALKTNALSIRCVKNY
ncbi:FISUMP domain-containing protein [Fibrobacter sp. UWH1]|uniref:FISUMP domain-containing protein n=1 Tax=Fibrobacter sp. UWH1 TaxID=1964354 RepID=UPI000B64A914|nr:FISUMP domain-containing protein [Fibrobacter sp. UWH1]OWV15071.1 hypothetical protein B7992_06030 [Fibrobacter sp. UWH1]